MADAFDPNSQQVSPQRLTPCSITTAFINHLIYDNILHRLSAASVLRLGRCSRLTQQATKDYIRMALDINRHLSRYFDNPLEFRTMQARTATLISGSTALQFFDRTYYPESDLDLYAHPCHLHEVGRWLLDAEGYTFQPNIIQESDFDIESRMRRVFWGPDMEGPPEFMDEAEELATTFHHQDQYHIPGVRGVYTFVKPARREGAAPRKVQVIGAERNPLECILDFHSSTVMNIIAWDAAYCLFPMATLEHHCALQTAHSWGDEENQEDNISTKTRAALRKYAQRGFQTSPLFGRTPENHALYLPGQIRRVNDAHSWTVRLDCAGVDPHAAPFEWDPVLMNSFKLWCSASGAQTRVKMDFRPTSSELFKYHYLISGSDQPYFKAFVLFCEAQGPREYARPSPGQSGETYWDCLDVKLPALQALFPEI